MFDNRKLESSMKSLQAGDSKAFNVIYDLTNRMVYYAVYSILKDHGRSEDVMQNVYLKVYEKSSQYQKGTSVKAWILTIAKNLAINEYHKYKKDLVVEPEQFDTIVEVRSHEDTPMIDLAKAHLPDDEFFIVMMCVTEGYTRREVGHLLDLSTSGVTWKLNQALNRLKSLAERSDECE